jgi:hypothetical protein
VDLVDEEHNPPLETESPAAPLRGAAARSYRPGLASVIFDDLLVKEVEEVVRPSEVARRSEGAELL